MKKRRTIPALSLLLLSLLGTSLFYSTVQSATTDITSPAVPNNQTIRILAEKLGDASEDEVNTYFEPVLEPF